MVQVLILPPEKAPEVPERTKHVGPIKVALAQAIVGGFVFVPAELYPTKSAQQVAYDYGKQHGFRIVCRCMKHNGVDGVGIWKKLAKPNGGEIDTQWEKDITAAASRP